MRPFALDYALPAMFIALLVLQIRGRVHILVALAGGHLSMADLGRRVDAVERDAGDRDRGAVGA